MTYDFTLYTVGETEITDWMIGALVEAGCDDGTVASRNGEIFITFSREDYCQAAAILSAIDDVEKSGTLLEVNYVVAERPSLEGRMVFRGSGPKVERQGDEREWSSSSNPRGT
jgi:hypothetical protein